MHLKSNLRQFVFAGRAYFTLVNPETGVRLTFKVKAGKNKAGPCTKCNASGEFRRGRFVGLCFACKGTGDTANAGEPPYFVRWLTGSASDASAASKAAYAYIGYIAVADVAAQRPVLRPGKSLQRISEDHVARKAFTWLLRHLDALPAPAELHHEGRCARCSRRLTDPSSIATGFGPDCAAELGIAMVEPESETAVAAGIAETSDVDDGVAA